MGYQLRNGIWTCYKIPTSPPLLEYVGQQAVVGQAAGRIGIEL